MARLPQDLPHRACLDDAPGKAEVPTYAVGETITVAIFTPGERVKVTGTFSVMGWPVAALRTLK